MASKPAPKTAYDRHASAGDLNSAASTFSEFEEVRLEELDAKSGGSGGDETEWVQGSGSDDNAANAGTTSTASSSPPLADAAGPLKQDPSQVVGKTTAAPPPDQTVGSQQGGSSSLAAGLASWLPAQVTPAAASSSTEADLSWRGQSAGGAPGVEGFAFDALAPVGNTGDVNFKPFEDLDQAAHKAVGLASAAAKDVSVKLLGGATEAKASLSKLAGDVSSWWASLDPSPKAAADAGASAPDTKQVQGQESSQVQALFGLEDTEELMECFACAVVQIFKCSHNAFSEPRQITIPGKLYITEKHVCFAATAAADATTAKVPLAGIKGINKQPSQRKGASETLRMDLGGGQWLVFEDFGTTAHVDETLALIEHLTDSS